MLKQMAEVTVLHHKSMETRTKIAKVIFLLTTCQVHQQKYLEEESHFKKKKKRLFLLTLDAIF